MRLLVLLFMFISLNLNAGEEVKFSPGEIIYNNLQIGQEYDFGRLSNIQFEVLNNDNAPVSVEIIKYIPVEQAIKEGFEPLPDLDWVKVYPESIEMIKPMTKAFVSVLISLPDDEKYLGKKYQVMLKVLKKPEGQTGTESFSRVLFTINPEKLAVTNRIMKKPARFKVTPDRIYIEDLKYGRNAVYSSVEIKNLSDRKITFQMVLAGEKVSGRNLWSGYRDFPDIESSQPEKNTFELGPGESAEGQLKLHVEEKERYVYNKYMLFINIRPLNEELVEEFYVPVFINMKY